MGKQYSVGLFGYGCVGQGFYHTLNHSIHNNIEIDKVCVKDVNKKRGLDSSFITFDKNDILKNADQDFIVELTDNAGEAFEIVKTALLNGKNAVSANKKMIAENMKELLDLQRQTEGALLYDAACAGSIPVIRTLEDYYQNEKVRSVRGILNGTSNYILTTMNTGNLTFDDALSKAQKLGIAESDPSLDISGADAKFKTCIISVHSNGVLLNPESLLTLGINSVTKTDFEFARSINSKIKLISHIHESADTFNSFVLPVFINRSDSLFSADLENNAIEIEGEFTSKQVYTGKGAGSYPTGMAVLSDIAALVNGYKYSCLKLKKKNPGHRKFTKPDYDADLKVYIGYTNPEDISGIQIRSIDEEDKSSVNKYLTGYCNLNSLKELPDDKLNKIFICAFDPFKDLNKIF